MKGSECTFWGGRITGKGFCLVNVNNRELVQGLPVASEMIEVIPSYRVDVGLANDFGEFGMGAG